MEINLLASLPQTKRDLSARKAVQAENRAIACKFGKEYFDGTRDQGYGGYYYDGRWRPVAKNIIRHFKLMPGDRMLDIGCAKGFLVKDLRDIGIDAWGIDVSEYAVRHCHPDVSGYIAQFSADELPYPSRYFDAALAINVLHNLDREGCIRALKEMARVVRNPRNCFVQVDAYRNEQEREAMENWVLTAKTYGTPDMWLEIFAEAGYQGDYCWTTI